MSLVSRAASHERGDLGGQDRSHLAPSALSPLSRRVRFTNRFTGHPLNLRILAPSTSFEATALRATRASIGMPDVGNRTALPGQRFQGRGIRCRLLVFLGVDQRRDGGVAAYLGQAAAAAGADAADRDAQPGADLEVGQRRVRDEQGDQLLVA